MIAIPRKRGGPKLSKYLPETLESQLRANVLDAVDDFSALGSNNGPQLIIGNLNSGCHGTYSHRREGTEFIFHHCKMAYSTQCRCIVRSSSAGETTFQIPQYLDDHRLRLIFGKCDDVPWRLEPKLAAMVAMKIFLGMDVPAPLGMKIPDGTTKPAREEEVGGRKQEEYIDTAS
ncbi:hypothetical protein F5B21DRAFT_479468 [Xylaria acuta]|nr:hypothetical protein F5B21DRAFT_479468 [Xylaria acuta]